MMCQNCRKNEANVRYTQIINGVKKQINVCEECAKELGLNSFEFNMPIHFSDFLGDFLDDYNANLLPNFVKETNKLCNNCGETYEEFIKTGFLGCPNDYNIFQSRLDSVLNKLQGNNRHIGRTISTVNKELNNIDVDKETNNLNDGKLKKIKEESISKENKINKLQEELKIAIKEERYEDAAKIRDELNNLKK